MEDQTATAAALADLRAERESWSAAAEAVRAEAARQVSEATAAVTAMTAELAELKGELKGLRAR